MNKIPKPEVCDSCLTEGNLIFNDESGEWLCINCNDLIKHDRREFDYLNGSKINNDIGGW